MPKFISRESASVLGSTHSRRTSYAKSIREQRPMSPHGQSHGPQMVSPLIERFFIAPPKTESKKRDADLPISDTYQRIEKPRMDQPAPAVPICDGLL